MYNLIKPNPIFFYTFLFSLAHNSNNHNHNALSIFTYNFEHYITLWAWRKFDWINLFKVSWVKEEADLLCTCDVPWYLSTTVQLSERIKNDFILELHTVGGNLISGQVSGGTTVGHAHTALFKVALEI